MIDEETANIELFTACPAPEVQTIMQIHDEQTCFSPPNMATRVTQPEPSRLVSSKQR